MDPIEEGLRGLSADADPPAGWQSRVHARIDEKERARARIDEKERRALRRRRIALGVIVAMPLALLSLCVWRLAISPPAASSAPALVAPAPAMVVAAPVVTLAIMLECSDGRRVSTWHHAVFERYAEMFRFERRPTRGEIWIVLLDRMAEIDRGYDDWMRTPWYVPLAWEQGISQHLHLTIGEGCTLGDQLPAAVRP